MYSLFENLVNKITMQLVADESIDVHEKEIYKFGIEVTLLKMLHIVSYLVIALFLNRLLEFTIVFLVFCFFRKNTGGFHAKTRWGCYIFSCLVILISLVLTEIEIESYVFMLVLSLIGLLIMWEISPVQNENRKLDNEEICYFRHRLIGASCIFEIIQIAVMTLDNKKISWLLTMGILMNTFLTLLGKMQYMLHIRKPETTRLRMGDIQKSYEKD